MSGGNVLSEMFAGRINNHGKIASLTSAFSLSSGLPFSICVVPNADIATGVIESDATNLGLIVSCKTFQGESATGLPVYFNTWTPAAIVELPASAINLTTYSVYWGACK